MVVDALKPIQERYSELRKDGLYLSQVLDDGRSFAREISGKKIAVVKKVVGLRR